MRRSATTTALTFLLTLAACGGSTLEDPFGGTPGASETNAISVLARNHYAEDVVIHLMSTSGVQQVGVLGPETERVFRVRWEEPRELRVRVEVVAGPRYTTNALARVGPGDLVEVRVPSNVRRSVIRRR